MPSSGVHYQVPYRDKQRLDSDRGSKGDTMDDSRSLRGCSELTLFARFLKKFVLRTPRWENRNTDQRLVRIDLQIQQTNHSMASITSKLGIVVLSTPVLLTGLPDIFWTSLEHPIPVRDIGPQKGRPNDVGCYMGIGII